VEIARQFVQKHELMTDLGSWATWRKAYWCMQFTWLASGWRVRKYKLTCTVHLGCRTWHSACWSVTGLASMLWSQVLRFRMKTMFCLVSHLQTCQISCISHTFS